MTENTTAYRCQLRQALRSDIPGMHRVRRAVRENPLTSDVIREEHYIPAIESSGRGWVVEEAGEVRAFAVGNGQTGNIWALFVDPPMKAAASAASCKPSWWIGCSARAWSA